MAFHINTRSSLIYVNRRANEFFILGYETEGNCRRQGSWLDEALRCQDVSL